VGGGLQLLGYPVVGPGGAGEEHQGYATAWDGWGPDKSDLRFAAAGSETITKLNASDPVHCCSDSESTTDWTARETPNNFHQSRDFSGSLQLGVFGLSSNKDGDVGVGIFPEREEVLIGSARFCVVAR
jgi:hypothetical protein